MRNLLALVVLVLVGCANPQVAYQKTMDTWIGVSEDNLISRWGVPSGTYESNNAKYITFVQVLPTVFYGGAAFPRQCKTTFTLRSNTVVSWQSQGQCN